MAYQPTEGSNNAFSAGVNHVQANGRDNSAGSITMPGSDPGLDETSGRWAGLTPHSVVSIASGAASSGIDFEGMQRLNNSYEPGSMGKFSDELSGGSDDITTGEE